MSDIQITDEAIQDIRFLINGMSDDQLKGLLISAIESANADNLTIEKSFSTNEDKSLATHFKMRFRKREEP